MNYQFQSLLMMIVITGCVIQAAVIRVPTVDNPCMRDPTSTGTPVHTSLRDQVLATRTAASSANTTCQRFKDAIIHANPPVLTQDEIVQLNSPLINVPGIPLGTNETNITAANNISSFLNDYQDVSTYIRFIEFFQSIQESSVKGAFSEELKAVKNESYTWLCTIDTILWSYNSPVTKFVDSSVVSSDFKQDVNDSKGWYGWNYIFTNNAQEFIANKYLKLTVYFLTLS